MSTIDAIEGIGPANKAKLAEAGIKTTDGLLDKGCTKKGRAELAGATGLPEATLLKWVNMADLFRVKGIASQNAELLKASGVDTVKELRNRNAANLAVKINEVNDAKKLARAVPTESQVQGWIDQAKELPPKVTY